jgi:hypothetical protein
LRILSDMIQCSARCELQSCELRSGADLGRTHRKVHVSRGGGSGARPARRGSAAELIACLNILHLHVTVPPTDTIRKTSLSPAFTV